MSQPDVAGLRDLLGRAGFPPDARVEPARRSGNNRAMVVSAGGRRLLAKSYFTHPADPRDRRATEWAFATYAWRHGVECVAEPVATDPVNQLALYAWLNGAPVRTVDHDAVQQAARFLGALNRSRDDAEAQSLPLASEAAFSLDRHLGIVDGRVHRLRDGLRAPAPGVDADAAAFVRDRLVPAWIRVEQATRAAAPAAGTVGAAELPRETWRLSPSDFGFHNALKDDAGRIWFIDFEYAGWDDPAKTVCDFLCQPAVPVPAELHNVATRALLDAADAGFALERARLLVPAYQVKWVCIMLNEFLPVGLSRRTFASAAGADTRKTQQLHAAATALDAISV